MKLYQAIARTLAAAARAGENSAYADTCRAHIDAWVSGHFPSGSGFDSGCKLCDESTPEKLVISADFHHMNDTGMYCGWSKHRVIVTPSLEWGYSLRITGRNTRDIKDYIGSVFAEVLSIDVDCF